MMSHSGPVFLLCVFALVCASCYCEKDRWRAVQLSDCVSQSAYVAKYVADGNPAPGFGDWLDSYQEALAQSRATGKPLAILFDNNTPISQEYALQVTNSDGLGVLLGQCIAYRCRSEEIAALFGVFEWPYWIIMDGAGSVHVDTPAQVPDGQPTPLQNELLKKRKSYRELRSGQHTQASASKRLLRQLGLSLGITIAEVAEKLRTSPGRIVFRNADDGLLYAKFASSTNRYLVPITASTGEQVYPSYDYSAFPDRGVSGSVALFYLPDVKYDYRPLVYAYFDKAGLLEDVFYIVD